MLLTTQLSAGTVPASYLLRHLFPVYTCTSNGPLEKSLIFLCSVLFVVFPCSPFPFGDDMDGKWLIVATGDNNNCIRAKQTSKHIHAKELGEKFKCDTLTCWSPAWEGFGNTKMKCKQLPTSKPRLSWCFCGAAWAETPRTCSLPSLLCLCQSSEATAQPG